MSKHGSLSSLSIALLLGALAVGCNSGVDAKVSIAQLDARCLLNSDCDALLICAFQRCHQACVTSRDCSGGAHCVGAEQPRHVCQLPEERSCGASGVCPGSEICGPDGQCRDGCTTNRDCVSGQLCVSATCADQAELSDAGTLPVVDGGTGLPAPCAFNSDCAAGLVCLSGACRAECATDADCPLGKNCKEARCEAPVVTGPACFYNSDCGKNQQCVAGGCLPLSSAPACVYDSDCATAGQHCVLGQCSCECAVSSDCPPNYECQAACACVPGRVISGDVTVTNSKEVRQLDDVSEITGTLTFAIRSGVAASFRLPAIKKLGSLSTTPALNTVPLSYELPALEEVGLLACSSCKLPALKTAKQIDYPRADGAPVSNVDLPELVSTGAFTLENGTEIVAVSAPKLTQVQNLRLDANSKLVSFSAPALTDATSVYVNGNDLLQTLLLPALARVGDVTFNSNNALATLDVSGIENANAVSFIFNGLLKSLHLPKLKQMASFYTNGAGTSFATLDFSALETVTSQFSLLDAYGITTLALPKLSSAGSFAVAGSLANLSLPSLTTVGDFSVAAPLKALSLPLLKTVGNVEVSLTQLQNLAALDPAQGSALQSIGNLSVSGNSLLPICAADALRKGFPGWAGMLVNTGNLACSCPGVACCNGPVCQ